MSNILGKIFNIYIYIFLEICHFALNNLSNIEIGRYLTTKTWHLKWIDNIK